MALQRCSNFLVFVQFRQQRIDAHILTNTNAKEPNVANQARRLSDVLGQLLESLNRALRKPTGSQAPQGVDITRAPEVLAQLKQLLQTGNFEANELAHKERDLLYAALGEPMGERLLKEIAAFDFDKALALLEVNLDDSHVG